MGLGMRLHSCTFSTSLYWYIQSHKKVFLMKASTCRDGTLKNQPTKIGTALQYIHAIPTSCAILPTMLCVCYEQSNHTPRCSREVSAAGLPWFEHFRVQCYRLVKCLLVGVRKTKFTAANLQYGVCAEFSSVLKGFMLLKGILVLVLVN